MSQPGSPQIEFEGDLPLPEVNLLLYRRIYVLEQWLRRVALAGFAARYGSRWNDAIPTEMGRNLKGRLSSLRNRVAFNTENSDNAFWCLTLDELNTLLVYDKTWPIVRSLTGFDREEFRARLEDLREIRNVIGHNRATTQYTLDVFDPIARALEAGIARFRDRLLYDFTEERNVGVDSSDEVIRSFYASRSPFGSEHIARDEYFYYLYLVPADNQPPLDLGRLLEHFDEVRRTVLCFLVNRQALGEYAIVWPRVASSEEHTTLLDLLGSRPSEPGTPYAHQNPRYVCHPKIWFVY